MIAIEVQNNIHVFTFDIEKYNISCPNVRQHKIPHTKSEQM
jgi:hypothetical protein